MDKRGLLTLKGLEYIASRRPRIVVLEQVAAILNKTHEKVWGFVRKTLTTLNYTFTFKVLNTKHFVSGVHSLVAGCIFSLLRRNAVKVA